jgi:hypothetical protein
MTFHTKIERNYKIPHQKDRAWYANMFLFTQLVAAPIVSGS